MRQYRQIGNIREDNSTGMMVGGIHSEKRFIQVKNRNSSAASFRISKSKQKKTKRLNYNFKSVSAQIMLSKSSNAAGKAVTKARGTLAMLLRKMGTGDYDEQELEHAIIHARKMERIAKKRVKHLRQEEEIEQKGTASEMEDDLAEKLEESGEGEELELSEEDLEQLMEEFERMVQESMEELAREADIDEMSQEFVEVTYDMDEDDLEELKKKHRSDELKEIMDADLKYLRAVFQKLEKEREALNSGQINSSGVALDIMGLSMPVEMPEMPVMAEGGSVDLTL